MSKKIEVFITKREEYIRRYERRIVVKRILTFVLALTITLGVCVTAFADYSQAPFSVETTSKMDFKVGTEKLNKKRGSDWYLSVNMDKSNISDTHRAVVRVYKGTEVISATWVYSGESTTPHGYNSDCQKGMNGITFRARLDTRDSGTLVFKGRFCYVKK